MGQSRGTPEGCLKAEVDQLDQKLYHTANINVGAFLKAHGLTFIGLKPVPGTNKKEFIFDPCGLDAYELVQRYYSGGAVNAKAFTEAIYDLRGALYNLGGRN